MSNIVIINSKYKLEKEKNETEEQENITKVDFSNYQIEIQEMEQN